MTETVKVQVKLTVPSPIHHDSTPILGDLLPHSALLPKLAELHLRELASPLSWSAVSTQYLLERVRIRAVGINIYHHHYRIIIFSHHSVFICKHLSDSRTLLAQFVEPCLTVSSKYIFKQLIWWNHWNHYIVDYFHNCVKGTYWVYLRGTLGSSCWAGSMFL